MDDDETPGLLTMEEAVQVLGLTPDELMALVEDGTLAPAPESGEDLSFRVDEVAAVQQMQRD